jgi:hypothetical protein
VITLRATETRDGNLVWLFLSGHRYAMLELDQDGDVVAGLSDRVGATGASDFWVVPRDGADVALGRIREFLDG